MEKVSIKLGEKEHELGYPTIGQYLDIENMKAQLSGGRYGVMVYQGTRRANHALNLIDTISYFTVLIGKEFLEYMGVKEESNILDMPMDSKVENAMKQYTQVYNPLIEKVEGKKEKGKGEKK